MPATTTMINNILNYNFGSQAYSPALPATMYFGLSTTLVNATGLPSATEPAGYVRKSFTNNTTNWNTSTVASLSNKVALVFAETTGDLGTIRSIFIATAASAGTILWYYTLAPAIVVLDNTVLTFAIGTIIVTMT